MADKRVKYIYDDGPFCEVGITGKQTSWRRNQSGFVTEANALLLIASGKFVLSSTDFATDQDGLDLHLSQHAAISSPIIKRFPTWPANAGCLLASLAASSTAARTANVVTVSATGHGITTGTTYVGFRFYYPGSTSLAAGWYDSILTIPDANTITFSAAGADFASESINSGSAWTTATEITSLTIAGGTLRDQSKVRVVTSRESVSGAISKTIGVFLGGTLIANSTQSTSSRIEGAQTFRCIGTNKQIGQFGFEGTATASATVTTTKDISVDQTLSIRGTVASASDYIAILGAYAEVIQ